MEASVFQSKNRTPQQTAYTKIGIYTYITNTGSGVKLSTAYMFSN